VATFSSITSQHVLAAIAEHDERGAEAFLAALGFTPSSDAVIVHEGSRYDARAVLAVAHRLATGRLATPEEFRSSLDQALAVLRRRGFDVTGPTAVARRAAAPRSSRAPSAPPRRKTALVERPAAVCPTCSMTLPATGVCDDCG